MASIFFSYSHRDEDLRNELEIHLALLKREGLVSAWHDRRIDAGGSIHGEISRHLEQADVVLLLVSAYFLASDYCFDKEMARALERESAGACIVVPVILRPCDWKSAPFGHLRATPTDGKPVVTFPNQDEALAIVAADIRRIVERKGKSNTNVSVQRPPAASATASRPAAEEPRSSNLRVRRKFSDQERDDFIADSFAYIERYFTGSLAELHERNQQIQGKIENIDRRSFVASIYDAGKRLSTCSVWYGGTSFGSGIKYSSSDTGPGNSMNEMLSVEDDGYVLYLKPMGMMAYGNAVTKLSQEGAAEYLWSILVRPLQ